LNVNQVLGSVYGHSGSETLPALLSTSQVNSSNPSLSSLFVHASSASFSSLLLVLLVHKSVFAIQTTSPVKSSNVVVVSCLDVFLLQATFFQFVTLVVDVVPQPDLEPQLEACTADDGEE
jgi:hypothetical protein